eukprot:tig00000492_g1498.t1
MTEVAAGAANEAWQRATFAMVALHEARLAYAEAREAEAAAGGEQARAQGAEPERAAEAARKLKEEVQARAAVVRARAADVARLRGEFEAAVEKRAFDAARRTGIAPLGDFLNYHEYRFSHDTVTIDGGRTHRRLYTPVREFMLDYLAWCRRVGRPAADEWAVTEELERRGCQRLAEWPDLMGGLIRLPYPRNRAGQRRRGPDGAAVPPEPRLLAGPFFFGLDIPDIDGYDSTDE